MEHADSQESININSCVTLNEHTCSECGNVYSTDTDLHHNTVIDETTDPNCLCHTIESQHCSNCGDYHEHISVEHVGDVSETYETIDGYNCLKYLIKTCNTCNECTEISLVHTPSGTHEIVDERTSQVLVVCNDCGALVV